MTISEFGRRPHENGSFGTDHGAASTQFLFGTQVASGVYGNKPNLENLDSNADLPWDIDYRQVYASILNSWFDMPLEDARTVLGDDSLAPINIIKPQTSSVAAGPDASHMLTLGVSPNPFRQATEISYVVPKDGYVRMVLCSLDGREIRTLVDGVVTANTYRLPLTLDLPNGGYILSFEANGTRMTRLLNCIH
jgi:hypothetical protein